MAGVDSQDLKSVLLQFPQQIYEGYKMGDYLKVEHSFSAIAICGMGGSSIAGMLLRDYTQEMKIPVYVVNDYTLPGYINKETLVVISSYSGNTEEAINCYREARKRQCPMIVLTSNGKLMKMAEGDNLPVVMIPKKLQPRNALAFGFFPLLRFLENKQLIEAQEPAVKETMTTLQKEGIQTMAKELAEKLYQKIPIIYGSKRFAAAAYRWRTQFNENAKALAFNHEIPEMNHNELNGFEHQNGPFHLVFLNSDKDHRRVQKRIKINKKLLREDIDITELGLKGKSYLAELFMAVYIGDLTSYYTALKYGTDPSPVPIIEELKKEMGPFL